MITIEFNGKHINLNDLNIIYGGNRTGKSYLARVIDSSINSISDIDLRLLSIKRQLTLSSLDIEGVDKYEVMPFIQNAVKFEDINIKELIHLIDQKNRLLISKLLEDFWSVEPESIIKKDIVSEVGESKFHLKISDDLKTYLDYYNNKVNSFNNIKMRSFLINEHCGDLIIKLREEFLNNISNLLDEKSIYNKARESIEALNEISKSVDTFKNNKLIIKSIDGDLPFKRSPLFDSITVLLKLIILLPYNGTKLVILDSIDDYFDYDNLLKLTNIISLIMKDLGIKVLVLTRNESNSKLFKNATVRDIWR